jgi:hypothetical protein
LEKITTSHKADERIKYLIFLVNANIT